MRFFSFTFMLVTLVGVSGAALPQDGAMTNDWSGFWLGTLPPDVGNLRLLLRIPESHSRHHPVALYSLDQGGAKIPANEVEMDPSERQMTAYFDAVNGRYEAQLDDTLQLLQGTWYQGPVKAALEFQRFDQQDNPDAVPREFRFLLEKAVTGDPDVLQKMVGFWSGYLDNSFDKEEKEPPELVILEMDKITNDLVEPQVRLPGEYPLAIFVRSMIVLSDGTVKVVLDDPMSGNNAIFQGHWEDDTITGEVRYDDVDYAPPLILKWSAERPHGVKNGAEAE